MRQEITQSNYLQTASGVSMLGLENWCQRRLSPHCQVRYIVKSQSHIQCDECRKVAEKLKNRRNNIVWKRRHPRKRNMRNLKFDRLKRKSRGPFKMKTELNYDEVGMHRFFDCPHYETCITKAARLYWPAFSCYCCREWMKVAV